LHDIISVWLLAIIVVVVSVFLFINIQQSRGLELESEVLEKTWTFVPILILASIARPSIHLLCIQDALCLTPTTRVKITRNQWRWQREQSDTADHLLDADHLTNVGSFETPVLIRLGLSRVVLRRTDVLHSLGMPRLGMKLDSVPGRLNTTTSDITSQGLILGSCYELCGRGHRVMPITILAT